MIVDRWTLEYWQNMRSGKEKDRIKHQIDWVTNIFTFVLNHHKWYTRGNMSLRYILIIVIFRLVCTVLRNFIDVMISYIYQHEVDFRVCCLCVIRYCNIPDIYSVTIRVQSWCFRSKHPCCGHKGINSYSSYRHFMRKNGHNRKPPIFHANCVE